MGVIDSLFVRLGFLPDTAGLEKFNGLAEKAKGAMLGLGAALTGAAVGIGLFVKQSAKEMDDIGDFAEMVGMSAREVQALGVVAMENDSSLEGMEGTIRSITVSTGQAAMGFGRAAMVFKKFGLHAKNADGSTKNFNEMLGDIAAKMQTLDLGKRNALGARLGIDPMLVKLLAQGKENFDALVEEARKENPFAEKDYQLAHDADVAFKRAHHRIGILRNQIAVALMPKVIELLDRFTKWTREESNVRKLTGAIDTVVKVLGFVWRHLGTIGAVFGVLLTYKMGAYFLDWGDKITKAARAMATLHVAGGLLKTLLTGGLIAAIGLIIEDLWVFYHGGQSVTGLLVNKWAPAIDVIKGSLLVLGSTLLALVSGSGPVGVFAFAIGGIILGAMALRDAWNPVMQWWNEQWDGLFNSIARVWNAIPKPARMLLGGVTTGDFSGEEMSLDVFKNAERSRLKLAQFGGDNYKPWGVEEDKPSWLTPRAGATGGKGSTTNINAVHFNFPHVTGGKEAAREANRELARLAHGGVGG